MYSNQEALTLHGGYNYKDACAFEIFKEEPPVEEENPDVDLDENDNQEKGCFGAVSTSLMAITPIALVVFIKKRKNKEEE